MNMLLSVRRRPCVRVEFHRWLCVCVFQEADRQAEALPMLEESSQAGCLQSSYMLWEHNRKSAVSTAWAHCEQGPRAEVIHPRCITPTRMTGFFSLEGHTRDRGTDITLLSVPQRKALLTTDYRTNHFGCNSLHVCVFDMKSTINHHSSLSLSLLLSLCH